MKSHRRPEHGRLSSITLRRQVSCQRDRAAAKVWKNVRLAVAAFLVTFAVYIAFHLLQHAKQGTNHQFSSMLIYQIKPVSGTPRYGDVQRSGIVHTDHQSLMIAETETRKRIYHGTNSLDNRLSSVNGHSFHSVPINGWNIQMGGDLSPPILAAWTAARTAVLATAESLSSRPDMEVFDIGPSPSSVASGIPRTDTAGIQAFLDCFTSNGHWVHNATRSNVIDDLPIVPKQHSSCSAGSVRHVIPSSNLSSLDWHWHPADECNRLLPVRYQNPGMRFSRLRLCSLLEGKHTLLIGDVPTQYKLHDLLLEYTNSNATSCYGNTYCTAHSMCDFRDLRDAVDHSNRNANNAFRSMAASEALYANEDVSVTAMIRSTWLRYRRSDSLFMEPTILHHRYSPQAIHHYTGIREVNTYAIPDLRRSDLTIFNKSPVPMPLDTLARIKNASDPAAVIQLAAQITIGVWLPELATALKAMRPDETHRSPILVYTSARRMSPRSTRLTASYSSSTLADVLANRDMRFVVHNLQTMLQNEAIRTIMLPVRKIFFLDLDSATSIWQSALPISNALTPSCEVDTIAQPILNQQGPYSTHTNIGDGLTLCLPSPGSGVETLFLGGVSSILSLRA